MKFVILCIPLAKRVIFQVDNLIYLNLSKIVVDAGHHPLTIEGNDTNQIHLLGTYEMTTKANEKLNLKQEDFLSVQTTGETMYVTLKSLPVQHTLWNSAPQVKPTLVLPKNKNVEIRASNNELSLYPGQLQNNWFVQESSRVSVHLAKESDVSLTAVTNQKETQEAHLGNKLKM